jgi:hypothetical protein
LLAMLHAAKEIIWWIHLFEKLGFSPDHDIVIHNDNLQTIRLLTFEVARVDTKLRHVNIAQCWLRQVGQNGDLKVAYLPTAHMTADGITKILPPQKHHHFLRQLGLCDTKGLIDWPAWSRRMTFLSSFRIVPNAALLDISLWTFFPYDPDPAFTFFLAFPYEFRWAYSEYVGSLEYCLVKGLFWWGIFMHTWDHHSLMRAITRHHHLIGSPYCWVLPHHLRNRFTPLTFLMCVHFIEWPPFATRDFIKSPLSP